MRKKPKQARSQVLVDSVVEAAEDALAKDDGFSMSKLARKAGVGVASIYEYFAKKESVLEAVLDRVTESNFAKLERRLEAVSDLPLIEAGERMIDTLVDMYLTGGRLTSAMIELVMRRGDLGRQIEYRDKFTALMAARLRADLTSITVEESEASMRHVGDLTLGVLVSELVRGGTDLDVVRRLLYRTTTNEILELRRIHDERNR